MSATKISRTNKEVVLGFIEEVINQKRLDRFDEYFAPGSVYHTGPYVGMGFNFDDLRYSAWPRGIVGTPVTVRVRRDGEIVDIRLEQFLNSLKGEVVAIIPNLAPAPLSLHAEVDFLLIVEKISE